MPSAYLAAPIDLTDINQYISCGQTVKLALQDAGLSVFSPFAAWSPSKNGPDGSLQRVNEAALIHCDMAVFVLPNVQTIGVVAELTQLLHSPSQVDFLVAVVDQALYERSWSLHRLLDKVTDAGGQVITADFNAKYTDLVYAEVRSAAACFVRSRRVLDVADAQSVPRHFVTSEEFDRALSSLESSEDAGDTTERREDTSADSGHVDLPFAAVGDAHAHVRLPHTANSRDAGLDLFVNQPVTIQPGQFVDVSCGVGAQLPEDSWALLTGRSSTFRKHKLLVINGIIDQGYRGELFAGVVNLGDEPVEVEAGWRLAQLIVIPKYADFNPVMVEELAEGERGTRGFGSSGV